VALVPVAVAPWAIGGTGPVYGIAALALTLAFLALSLPVGMRQAAPGDGMRPEKRLFAFSVFYLFALFAALVADRLLIDAGVIA
jgi:protoheme IX farnesyltransferase